MKFSFIFFFFFFLVIFTPIIQAPYGYNNPSLPQLVEDLFGDRPPGFFMPNNKSVFGNFSFGGLCLDGGTEIREGSICTQTLEVFNITSVNITRRNITVLENFIVNENVTADNFIGFCEGNNTQWSKAGNNIFPTVITDNIGIGVSDPSANLEIKNTNPTFRMSDPSVVHGMTDALPTNVFGAFDIRTAGAGGFDFIGASDTASVEGLRLAGAIGDATPTTTAIVLAAFKKSGTGAVAIADAEGMIGFANGPTIVNVMLGDGSLGLATVPTSMLDVKGDIELNDDGDKLFFGASQDVSINFNASQTQFTNEVGSGNWNFLTGNVGIGTVSPGEKFVVDGDTSFIEVNHDTDTSFGGIRLSEVGTPQNTIQTVGSNFATVDRRGDLEIFSASGDITFQIAGGNVGIGTSAPQNALNVIGEGNFSGRVFGGGGGLLINWSQATNGTLADNSSIATYINAQDIIFNTTMGIYVIAKNDSLATWVDSNFVELTGDTMSGNLAMTHANSPTIVLTDTDNTVQFTTQVTDTLGIFGMTSNHPLFLVTDNTVRWAIAAGGTTIFSFNTVHNDNVNAAFGSGSDATISYDGTDMQFDSQAVGTGNYIFNNGSLGIGTASPDFRLQVNGSIAPEETATSSFGSSALRWLKGWFSSLDVAGNITATGNITSENVFIPQYIFPHTNATIPLASANNWKNISFDQEETNIKFGIDHSGTDSTNQTFTINIAGVYNLEYDFDVIDTSPSATDVDVAGRIIFKNGTEILGSAFENDITKQQIETEISHSTLARFNVGDQIIFQFIADDVDVAISTHGTFGDHPDSATVIIEKVANL